MLRCQGALAAIALLNACSESGLKVQNEPPEVNFTSPADGADVAEGEALVLVASVVDLESSNEDLEYSWTLSDGGYLLGEQTIADRDVALAACAGRRAAHRRLRSASRR